MPKEISQIFPAVVEDGKMRLLVRVVLLLVLVCTISCRDRDEQSVDTQKSMQSEKMSRIESETGLTFSDNCRLVHFLQPEVFVDPVWVAKVVIPALSYESFRQALLKKPADETIYDGALADSTSWWKPTNIVLTKQYLANRQTFVNVVVSKEGEEFVVYIECAVF